MLAIIASTNYNQSVYYVYILQSLKKSNWLYKGSTSNLKRRVSEHNTGKNFSTKGYIPLKLIYYEAYLLKTDAEAREKYLKTSMGMRVIKRQLAHFLKFK
jgi:putative endonuclease